MQVFKSTWIMLRTILRTLSRDLLHASTFEDATVATAAWAKDVLGYADVRLKVRGAIDWEQLRDQPVLVMCNHNSMYDIPISIDAFQGRLRFLSKEELAKIPGFKRVLNNVNAILLNRSNPKQALKQLRRGQSWLKKVPYWCAPEGTRSPDGQLLPFKKGVFLMALSTQAIILPIAIQGAEKIMPKGGYLIHTSEEVTLSIGQPIASTQYSARNMNQLMDVVRQQIKDMLAA